MNPTYLSFASLSYCSCMLDAPLLATACLEEWRSYCCVEELRCHTLLMMSRVENDMVLDSRRGPVHCCWFFSTHWHQHQWMPLELRMIRLEGPRRVDPRRMDPEMEGCREEREALRRAEPSRRIPL